MYDLQYVLDNSKTTGYGFSDGIVFVERVEQLDNLMEFTISNLFVSDKYNIIDDTIEECVNLHDTLNQLYGKGEIDFDISTHNSRFYENGENILEVNFSYSGYADKGTRIGEAIELFMSIINKLTVLSNKDMFKNIEENVQDLNTILYTHREINNRCEEITRREEEILLTYIVSNLIKERKHRIENDILKIYSAKFNIADYYYKIDESKISILDRNKISELIREEELSVQY